MMILIKLALLDADRSYRGHFIQPKWHIQLTIFSVSSSRLRKSKEQSSFRPCLKSVINHDSNLKKHNPPWVSLAESCVASQQKHFAFQK